MVPWKDLHTDEKREKEDHIKDSVREVDLSTKGSFDSRENLSLAVIENGSSFEV